MLAQEHELSSIEAANLTTAGNTATTAGAPITLTNFDPPRPQDKGGCCAAA